MKKLLTILLALTLVVGTLSMGVLAADPTSKATVEFEGKPLVIPEGPDEGEEEEIGDQKIFSRTVDIGTHTIGDKTKIVAAGGTDQLDAVKLAG